MNTLAANVYLDKPFKLNVSMIKSQFSLFYILMDLSLVNNYTMLIRPKQAETATAANFQLESLLLW